eukprot:2993893-Pleurochrysis_carterae.AAC.14
MFGARERRCDIALALRAAAYEPAPLCMHHMQLTRREVALCESGLCSPRRAISASRSRSAAWNLARNLRAKIGGRA